MIRWIMDSSFNLIGINLKKNLHVSYNLGQMKLSLRG